MLVSDDSFAYHRFDTIAADHHVRLEAAAVLVADSGTCFILLERPDLGACVEPNARVRPDRFENRKMNVCTMDHRERGIDMVPARQLVRQRRAQFGRLADLDAALPESHPIRRRHCHRSEEPTYELQSLMRISYAVFCLKQKINHRDY